MNNTPYFVVLGPEAEQVAIYNRAYRLIADEVSEVTSNHSR